MRNSSTDRPANATAWTLGTLLMCCLQIRRDRGIRGTRSLLGRRVYTYTYFGVHGVVALVVENLCCWTCGWRLSYQFVNLIKLWTCALGRLICFMSNSCRANLIMSNESYHMELILEFMELLHLFWSSWSYVGICKLVHLVNLFSSNSFKLHRACISAYIDMSWRLLLGFSPLEIVYRRCRVV